MISAGAADGVRAVLDTVVLPAESLVSMQEEHVDAFREHFHFPSGCTPMRRMLLDSAAIMPAASSELTPTLMQQADIREMESLYELYPESTFTADNVDGGVFFGIRNEHGLVAIAGTHVVSKRFGIAAIGSVFTHPGSRGRGYAPLTTAAVVRELRARSVETIVLNVAAENTTAGRIYERLGFNDYCVYFEGRGVLRTSD